MYGRASSSAWKEAAMQRAKSKFHVPGRWVAKGELFDDDDPFLNGREVLFEHIDVPEPQSKTAAPKPARKTAAKKPG